MQMYQFVVALSALSRSLCTGYRLCNTTYFVIHHSYSHCNIDRQTIKIYRSVFFETALTAVEQLTISNTFHTYWLDKNVYHALHRNMSSKCRKTCKACVIMSSVTCRVDVRLNFVETPLDVKFLNTYYNIIIETRCSFWYRTLAL